MKSIFSSVDRNAGWCTRLAKLAILIGICSATFGHGVRAQEQKTKIQSPPEQQTTEAPIPAAAAMAFKRGLPFYITEVTFESPDTVNLTVLSNPTIASDKAIKGVPNIMGVRDDSLRTIALNPREVFTASPKAQKVFAKSADWQAPEFSVIVVRIVGLPTGDMFRDIQLEYTASNRIQLKRENGAWVVASLDTEK